MNNTTCPTCGKEFECGSMAGKDLCWCFSLPNIIPIEENAQCLCNDCLQKRIKQMLKTEPAK